MTTSTDTTTGTTTGTSAPANPNKALWEKGDFTQIADTMRGSGEDLVRRIGVTSGLRVLDLGCGDGTTRDPFRASRGERARGRHRRQSRGRRHPPCRAARAHQLHVRGGRRLEPRRTSTTSQFDLVVSVFGAMFAPRPFDTAAEMVRVTKPGGRIVMGNWIPGDPTLVAQILRISGVVLAAATRGVRQPGHLGCRRARPRALRRRRCPERPHHVRARHVACSTATAARRDFVAMFRDFYGPTMNAFAAAEADGRAADLQAELEELFEAQNTSHRTGPHGDPGDLPPGHRRPLTAGDADDGRYGRTSIGVGRP